MAKDPKRIADSGLVCWLRFGTDDAFELLTFVPEGSIGYPGLLAFFSKALEDLRRYGKASRHLTKLSQPEQVELLGPRRRRTRLIETIVLRAEASLPTSSMSEDEKTVTWHLNEAGLGELVQATERQVQTTQRYFHGSFASWGFGYAIDWAGAE